MSSVVVHHRGEWVVEWNKSGPKWTLTGPDGVRRPYRTEDQAVAALQRKAPKEEKAHIGHITTEFPNFDLETLPPIPAHWTDESWHNDCMPQFRVGNYWVQVDYADVALREYNDDPNRPRFCAYRFDIEKDDQAGDVLLWTDDWSAMVDFVEKRALGEEYKELVGYDPFEDDPTNSIGDVRALIAGIKEIDRQGGLDKDEWGKRWGVDE